MILPTPATRVAASISWARATLQARKAALLLFAVTALLAAGVAPAPGQSALDGFDPSANEGVRVVVVQPDGKILLGGDFTALSPHDGSTVTRNHIARLNPDGTLDTAFDPNANGVVFAIAVQPDGKILASGQFTNIGGQPRNHIARLDPTTGLADSFDPNSMGTIYAVAVQTDGKIVVSGAFRGIGGQARINIARLDATTGLADSFDPAPAPAGIIYGLAVQPDGKILAGGSFTTIGGATRNHIARLDPTTGLADSFDPNANDMVMAITVQPDGKILVGGFFDGANSIGGETRNHMARLDATSGLADSFDPNPDSAPRSIVVQADGKILAGGSFDTIGGQARSNIARLDPTTGLADSFDPGANKQVVWCIAVQADGKILAGGTFTNIAGQTRNRIARLETDGRPDRTLDAGIFGVGGYVLATAVQADGKILVGGFFSTVLGVARGNIARLNADGSLDPAFNPGANATVNAIAVQVDGKVLAGGAFTGIGGKGRNRIARLDAVTGLADSFNPNVSGGGNTAVYSIAVQADGSILVAGDFTNVGGETRNHVARLDAATGLVDSFDPNANDEVVTIAVQADGKILAGGFFNGENSIGGEARNNIARLDPMTGLADSFDPDADRGVLSIAVQPDGKILAGGQFDTIGGQTRYRIARLDAATGAADSFDPGTQTGAVISIMVQADGKILAGGRFTSLGGETRNNIARLDATTGLADSFDPNANNDVYAITLSADGKVLAGGAFTSIGGETRTLFGRLSNDTAALQNLAVTRTTITWERGGSSPHLRRVTFESSTDNLTYAPLGSGIPQSGSSNWILTGLSLPTGQNFYVRARGFYRSGYESGSESITESVRNAFVTPGAQPLNLSTRMRVQTGNNVGIGGFIITGTAPKHVLLRAIGPSLAESGVPDVLADPTLELHDGQSGLVIFANDNWRDDPVQESQILFSGLAPANDLEAAIDITLAPGNYTAVVRGRDETSGVALVEVYDLNQSAASKLANLSTRAFISTSDNIVIAGFMLGGNNGDDGIIVRGLGPSLAALGVPDALADPTLELRDGNGALLRANNDWQDDPAQASQLIAAGLALANQLEPGLAMTLPPGPYTALLAGLNNGTGVGVVEVYDLGTP
ncbi:MAG TPA: delta-60 repeat domain-containing protein [Chthoniobacterales bacterium]|nr:delta-60 repeat domain-containing protein [Chthoniobacterales bacterium]